MTTQRNLRGTVSGRVQGVGFRYFVSRLARAEGLNGYVRNLPDGRVEFEIGGDADAVARLLAKIRIGPDHARVSDMQIQELDTSVAGGGFDIAR